jgi:signal peptidase II
MSVPASDRAGARWLWLSLAVLAVDRATKFAIERYTSPYFRFSVISDIVMLVHNQNPGIAFGVFSNSTSPWLAPLLLITSALVIAVLGWLLVNGRVGGRLAQAGLALILGGAAGNALDRLIHGGVTDFVEIRLGTFSWPAFNVADSAISIGAALVVVELVFGGQRRSDSAERDRG